MSNFALLPDRPIRSFVGAAVGGEPRVRLTLSEGAVQRVISWDDVGALDWSSFALVLGAGGATGAAYEAGIMLALAVDHHVRPADAQEMVGTSAGSVAASLISLGFEAADVAALIAGAPHHMSDSAARYDAEFVDDVPRITSPAALFRWPTPLSVLRAVNLIAHRKYIALLMQSMRSGSYDFRQHLSFLDGVDWPDAHALRICAVDRATGERVVFAAGGPVSLVDAVTASCAVPAVMRPVLAGGSAYVDGGVSSPTNADLVAGKDHPDLVVVLSPMSGDQSRTAAGRLSARYSARRLQRELRSFNSRQRVLVIEPSASLSSMVVDDALSTNATQRILATAFTAASM